MSPVHPVHQAADGGLSKQVEMTKNKNKSDTGFNMSNQATKTQAPMVPGKATKVGGKFSNSSLKNINNRAYPPAQSHLNMQGSPDRDGGISPYIDTRPDD